MAERIVDSLKFLVEDKMPMLLRSLVSSVSNRDFSLQEEQLDDIRKQIDTCCDSLDSSDDRARAWVTQARELAYDVEDWLDLFRLHIYYGDSAFPSSRFLEWFRGCKDIANKRRDLKSRFNALMKLKQEPPAEFSSGSVPRPMDDPPPTKFQPINTECLVGLDAATDEVTKIVMDAGDKAERKIISITGMAGSGKTTLAATVYQRLGEQNGFQCRAFVFVGPKPDLRRIRKELLSQLGDEQNANEETDQKLVSSIEQLLKDKRYLVVLDDLWYFEADWEKIKDCFPDNNLGSRIITTTRNDKMASLCSSGSRDYIHKMGLLSDTDSKQLFLKQLEITGGRACPPYWDDDVSDQIMRRCGGLPLALVSVAAMVGHEPSMGEWDWLGSNLLSSSHMDRVKHILNLSYKDLSRSTKSCLLYLSIFPENYMVEIKRLARLCTAEGFVYHFITWREFEEVYLNKLISGNMLQLLHTKNDHGSGSSWYCRLHPVIHDFIVCKSKEENFITRVDAQNQHEPIHHEAIRRLSIQSSDKHDEALPRNVTMNLTHVRSVTVFGQATAAPRLTALSLSLRVLDLEGCNGPVCLDGLHNLRLLIYLSLRGTDVSELPATISMLRFLEVLDVASTKVRELPRSIGALRSLEYLSVRGTDVTELPDTIGKLSDLKILDAKSTEARTKVPETICYCRKLSKLVTLDLSDHLPSFVESLGHLWSPRVIALTWSSHQCIDEAYRIAFLSCIKNWTDLTSLTIHCGLGCSMEFLGSLPSNPRMELEKFKVTAGRFASVPKWFRNLNNLSFVQITICKQGTEQLEILGDLPSLRRLILGLDFITENPMVIESWWFPKLERFSVDCPRPWLSFSARSMRRLTYLELKLCACPVSSVPSGIDKLQRIEEVSICYRSLEQRSPNISTIVGAMRQAVTEHHNRIDLFINGTPQHYNAEVAEEEASSSAGTGIGTYAGIPDDIQRRYEELVNATMGIQSTTEIEEIESED